MFCPPLHPVWGVTTQIKVSNKVDDNRINRRTCQNLSAMRHVCGIAEKVFILQGKLWVDVGFWGGLVPENANDFSVLEDLLRAGALGFKSFMSPSGTHLCPF